MADRVSSFYTDGAQEYRVFCSGPNVTCLLTKTLEELFGSGIESFDNSICLNFCSNNERVNTSYRYVGDSQNNCNIGWEILSEHTYADFYWKENIPPSTTKFIGTVLLGSTKGTTTTVFPTNSLFSLKRFVDGYGSNSSWKDLRFVLDVGGNGFNDLYTIFSGSDTGISGYTPENYYTSSSLSLKYCKDLMTRDVATIYSNSYYLDVYPFLVWEVEDEIYLMSVTCLHPWARFFYYNGSYQIDNFNKFSVPITKTTSSDKTFTGAFGDESPFYLDFIGKMDIPTEKTEAPLFSDEAYTISYKRYASGSTSRDALWSLKADLCKFNWNMFGLKWLLSGENTSTLLPTKMKLPYMDENCAIDCERWVEGLSDIKNSDSKNVDMDFSKLPIINTGGGDDKLAEQNRGFTTFGSHFVTTYLLNQANMNNFTSEMHSSSVEDILRPMDYVISLAQAPSYLLTHCHISTTQNIKLGELTLNTAEGGIVDYTFGDINLGSIEITNPTNSFLDYDPYTKLVLYVPFCGYVTLPTDIVMGKTITLWCNFDIETGDLLVLVYCMGAYITSLNGNACRFIPLSKDNSMLKFINAVSGVGQDMVFAALGRNEGNVIANGFNAEISILNSMGRNVNDYRKGNGTNNSFYAPMKPCLFYYTPKVIDEEGYGKSRGFACSEYGKLSGFSGMTVCRNPHITIQCTDTEKEMIKNWLEKGVIL